MKYWCLQKFKNGKLISRRQVTKGRGVCGVLVETVMVGAPHSSCFLGLSFRLVVVVESVMVGATSCS